VHQLPALPGTPEPTPRPHVDTWRRHPHDPDERRVWTLCDALDPAHPQWVPVDRIEHLVPAGSLQTTYTGCTRCGSGVGGARDLVPPGRVYVALRPTDLPPGQV
jgi:hypothetical protein